MLNKRPDTVERLIDTALAGASAVREGRSIGAFQGSRKADGSLVTDSDYASQAAIIDAIHKNFPRADILAEEHPYSVTARDLKGELLVVDPLDGTTNFTLGLTIWAISIALFQDCELVAGVVVQPETGDLYYATLGAGAFHENLKLSARAKRLGRRPCNLADAVIALEDDPSDLDSRDQWWRWLNILKPPRTFRVRTFECASLELCWVAASNLAGYLHPSDRAWDMAAGGLVAREAGCDLFSADWQPWDPLGRGVIALAPEVASELMPLLQAR